MSNDDFSNYVEFGVNDRSNLKLANMDYIKCGKGINMLKLHGSLNEFTYNDDKKIAYVNLNKTDNPMDYLQRVYNVTNKMEYKDNGRLIRVTNEIPVSDMNGQLQFLRQTIKTGGNKFSKSINPKPGEEKMALFEQILDTLDEITIVGYSFCDYHINTRIEKAMYKNENLKTWVINPSDEKNDFFDSFNYDLRVRKMQCCTPEWINYNINDNWNIVNDENLNSYRKNRNRIDNELRDKIFK